jgi:hypothetical protein
VLGKVIHQYADALASHPASWPLVPPYLCHLRERVRGLLLARLVRAAVAVRAADADCLGLHAQLAATLEAWRERQGRLEEEIAAGRLIGDPDCGPTSLLSGDVRRDELRALLAGLMAAARAGPADGPLERARLLRWLYYPFVAAQAAAAAAGGGGGSSEDGGSGAAGGGGTPGPLAWDASWGDALHHTVGLAAELALSPGGGAGGALRVLMEEVVPPGFFEAVEEAVASQLPELVEDELEVGGGPGGRGRGGGGERAERRLAPPARPATLSPLPPSPPSPCRQVRLVERQLAGLAFWSNYAALDAEYRGWKADWGGALLARGADDDDFLATGPAVDLGHATEEAAARGAGLAERLLQLAAADALLGLAAPELDGAAGEDPTRARLLVVAAGGGGGGQGQEGALGYQSSMVRGGGGLEVRLGI